MDAREMRERVGAAGVARLATVDGRGRPHLVPFCFVLDGDTLYTTVDDKPKNTTRLKRLRNIEANPRVSVLVDHYEDDWPKVWWVRADGAARVVGRGPERERAVVLLRAKYPQYTDQVLDEVVLAIDADVWRGWSYS